MKILLAGNHRYPAACGGPSGGRVFDWLSKGLVELGHQVLYLPGLGADRLPVDGVQVVDHPCWDIEILHCHSHIPLFQEARGRGLPWVATCHTDRATWGLSRDAAWDNWIFVSRTLAATYGRSRFVWNGIDPSDLHYSTDKENYLLFVCALKLAERKGLQLAIDIARNCDVDLVVAGSSPDSGLVARIAALCNQPGVRYVGEIWGEEKAMWFARARALLFPTQLNEAFGLVIAEALMSGTPVVCSRYGACPELITAECGFLCDTEDDYVSAIHCLDAISHAACRRIAMERFHYQRMARQYVREYERELNRYDR